MLEALMIAVGKVSSSSRKQCIHLISFFASAPDYQTPIQTKLRI
jgi:hypothetical protein